MNDFEITLPTKQEIIIDATDPNLYNYSFDSYSLVPLQKAAGIMISEKIIKGLFAHISEAKLIDALSNIDEVEYVAKFSDFAKGKLNSGEWSMGIRKKTGETYAVLKDSVTGKSKSIVTLDEKIVNNLGHLPELSAIQSQLRAIADQIESLNRLVERVEQGQYNDRYAGFFSARQMVIEALVSSNNELKQELLIAAIKTNNNTIAKLMLAIHQDSVSFIDIKVKPKEAKRIDNLLQNSIGYLNSAIQLNLIAYTVLEEPESLISVLSNYQSFINQTLLKKIGNREETIAWRIDNAHKGNDGRFNQISLEITNRISSLIKDVKNNKIGVDEYEKIDM